MEWINKIITNLQRIGFPGVTENMSEAEVVDTLEKTSPLAVFEEIKTGNAEILERIGAVETSQPDLAEYATIESMQKVLAEMAGKIEANTASIESQRITTAKSINELKLTSSIQEAPAPDGLTVGEEIASKKSNTATMNMSDIFTSEEIIPGLL